MVKHLTWGLAPINLVVPTWHDLNPTSRSPVQSLLSQIRAKNNTQKESFARSKHAWLQALVTCWHLWCRAHPIWNQSNDTVLQHTAHSINHTFFQTPIAHLFSLVPCTRIWRLDLVSYPVGWTTNPRKELARYLYIYTGRMEISVLMCQ